MTTWRFTSSAWRLPALLVLLWTTACPVFAEEAPPPAAAAVETTPGEETAAFGTREEEANEHYFRAKRAREEQHFERSIGELKAAYALDPRPIYLYNIAQCYRFLERHSEALAYYRRFLSEEPETAAPKTRQDALAFINLITNLIQERELLARETHRPLHKRAWFWGILTSATVATGLALGIGLWVGLKDPRLTIYAK